MLERCEKVIAPFLISSFFWYLSHLRVSAHQTTIKSEIKWLIKLSKTKMKNFTFMLEQQNIMQIRVG